MTRAAMSLTCDKSYDVILRPVNYFTGVRATPTFSNIFLTYKKGGLVSFLILVKMYAIEFGKLIQFVAYMPFIN